MSKTREWGDHIILQALVEAYNLKVTIFNVFEDDVRHNVLQPGDDTKRKLMQVFLGHIGEFHYLSLRPCHWTDLWPYSKYVYRLMVSYLHLKGQTCFLMVSKRQTLSFISTFHTIKSNVIVLD